MEISAFNVIVTGGGGGGGGGVNPSRAYTVKHSQPYNG